MLDTGKLGEASKTNRIEALDWLRGLMAVAVMLSHLSGKNDAATLIGKLDIYAVAIFFIVSGLSIALAYDRYIVSLRTAAAFCVRRAFRIWPMLWLMVTFVSFSAWLQGSPLSWRLIAINLTTAFGFVAPTRYINTGAWSIGNEMVYYALTPLLIPAYRLRRHFGDALALAALLVFALFAFRFIDARVPLPAQWAVYVNPFNNLFFYCAGVALFYHFRDTPVHPILRALVLPLAITAFVLYPTTSQEISIVSGPNRLGFGLIVIVIVFGFYRCAPPLPGLFAQGLKKLGAASYGVYLLHPGVMQTLAHIDFLGTDHSYLRGGSVVSITIVLALVLFRYFESPCIRLGKRLTVRW